MKIFKKSSLKPILLVVGGLFAGFVNGLLGAGGGIIIIYLLLIYLPQIVLKSQ